MSLALDGVGPEVVASIEALRAFGRRSAFAARPPRLILDLPGLAPEARAHAEVRLARALSACGCEEGSLALILSLPAAVVLGPRLSDGLAAWAIGLAIVVAGAAAGKTLGLLRAHAALAAEVARVLELCGHPDRAAPFVPAQVAGA